MNGDLVIRSAAADDIDRIFELLEIYAAQKVVLARSKEDIAFYIGNFTVAECDGRVCGCVAVRDFGNDLLEIRSLVVDPEMQNCGVGKAMINAIVEKVKSSRQYWRLFALTLRPDFFISLGFKEVPRALFPEKIWSDCLKCSKLNCCDETALLMESE